MKTAAATKFPLAARAEHGQTMAEYSVIVALITLAVVAGFALLNGAVLSMFGRISGYLTG